MIFCHHQGISWGGG